MSNITNINTIILTTDSVYYIDMTYAKFRHYFVHARLCNFKSYPAKILFINENLDLSFVYWLVLFFIFL